VKLEKFKNKLVNRQTLSSSVTSQNAFISDSMNELEQLSPEFIQLMKDRQKERTQDKN
jgi:hypothetical protein